MDRGPQVALAVLLAAAVLHGAPSSSPEPPLRPQDRSPEQQVEHGRYLVHHVAMCVECHTPRDARGRLLEERLLHGAPIPVEGPFEPWTFRSAHIAGLPGYTREEGVRLLMVGLDPQGDTPRPPMPAFRMSRADAEAVVSYLLSLH